jgi:hypothetical protein
MAAPFPLSYRINEKNVAHEIMDGEAILIHFETGNYYSLKDSAASIWAWLAAGATVGEIVAAFQNITPEDSGSIRDFLERLAEEGILTPVNEGEITHSGEASLPAPGSTPFAPVVFEKYNDMKQLLLSDPIHEVDERGWPHTQPDSRA